MLYGCYRIPRSLGIMVNWSNVLTVSKWWSDAARNASKQAGWRTKCIFLKKSYRQSFDAVDDGGRSLTVQPLPAPVRYAGWLPWKRRSVMPTGALDDVARRTRLVMQPHFEPVGSPDECRPPIHTNQRHGTQSTNKLTQATGTRIQGARRRLA